MIAHKSFWMLVKMDNTDIANRKSFIRAKNGLRTLFCFSTKITTTTTICIQRTINAFWRLACSVMMVNSFSPRFSSNALYQAIPFESLLSKSHITASKNHLCGLPLPLDSFAFALKIHLGERDSFIRCTCPTQFDLDFIAVSSRLMNVNSIIHIQILMYSFFINSILPLVSTRIENPVDKKKKKISNNWMNQASDRLCTVK